MELLIVNQSKTAVPRKFLTLWVGKLSKELRKRKVLTKEQSKRELTLVFLDKKPAKKLNLEFRGKDYATDVLSFDSLEPSSFGELILCPDVLKKQSKEHKMTYQLELGYMVLHGVLHLLGYDHEASATDAEEMFKIQDRVFEALLAK